MAARELKVLLAACGGWYLPNTAMAFHRRDSLAELWTTRKNEPAIPSALFRRCWVFHAAMKPFYHVTPQIWTERAFYSLFPLWRWWALSRPWPQCNVVQAIMGYGTEVFDRAENCGALKVLDCQNSHPTSYRGYWKRELDLWCPGQRTTIPDWMFGRMNRELERADVILCPSLFVRDTMVQNGLPAGKCVVNPFGVDTSTFVPRQRAPSRPRFICVGTICVRKGHQYLFRAFQRVKEQLPEAELICVGPWSYDFRQEREKWETTFTHHPFLGHSDLANLLRECTAFVLPSVEEGFARVLSEAMGAGLPIIATYESGANTLVRDGIEGIIVPVRNPEEITRAMVRLGKEPLLSEHMGQAAYAAGARNNDWQHYGDRLLEAYAAIVERCSS